MHRADSAPRKLTVVAHEIGPFGGMESQLAALVAAMLARGVEVTAIGRRIELEPHENLSTVTIAGPSRPFPLAYIWFFLAGSLAVARFRSGKVYAIGAIVLNRVDANKVPFCHVAWARNPARASRASRPSFWFRVSASISAALSRRAEWLVYRPSRSGGLVAMSTGGAAELDELFPALRPAAVIPNGVDLERFAPNSAARTAMRELLGFRDDDLVCAFVGGDWRRKGLPLVIEALAVCPRWRLVVVGSGDPDDMNGIAQKFGVGERITYVGRVNDPQRYLAASDALAMPSNYEPWGNAVLEACAAALPVVVAAGQGVNDFIEPNVSGLIAEADPRSIAAALHSLEDPAARRRIGDAARGRAARYSFDQVASEYSALLFNPPQAPAPTLQQIQSALR